MSSEHKAFVFDYSNFEKELMDVLTNSLESSDVDDLRKFIEQNLSSLKDPYEGELLGSDWQSLVEVHDAHQYGDFAITKFYDPASDLGVGYRWEELSDLICRELHSEESVLLGKVIGPESNPFDPGKLGSYFQSSQEVAASIDKLKTLILGRPELEEALGEVIDMFESCLSEVKGLYVTF